jgi:hypothetical protein
MSLTKVTRKSFADITNGNGAASSSTPLPERVKSAPTAGRYDIMAATPTSSPKGQLPSMTFDTCGSVGFPL